MLYIIRGIRRAVEEWTSSSINIPLEYTWNVPYQRNPFFTGQESILSSLYDVLEENIAANLTQPQAISGLGGIGKTQIAIEYAYRYRDRYRVILWSNAESRTALAQSFLDIAQKLQLLQKDNLDISPMIEVVKHWLNTHDQWLFIFDNVEDASLIYDVLPEEANGHILVTTRSQLLGDIAQNIEVEQMRKADGVLLLLKRAKILTLHATRSDAKDAPDRATAEELVRELGGLPLALDQAGAYIDQTHCGVPGYLEIYSTHRASLLKERGTKVTSYPASVATTWSLNFKEVEKKSEAATRLLHIYAFLYPDDIPEELEISPMKGQRLPKWLIRLLHVEVLTGDRVAFNETIKLLRDYSLVQRDTIEKTISVHRLVQAVLQDELSGLWQETYAINAIYFVSVAFPDPDNVVEWPRCERYILHAQACAVWIKKWKLTSKDAVTLLSSAARYLNYRGQYNEAELFLLHTVSILEQRHKQNKAELTPLAISINNLADLYWKQGKYEQTEQLMQRSLSMLEQRLGPHHLLVAGLLNNLAEVYRTEGKYEQAKVLHQQALSIREHLLEPDHPDIALSLNNLAGIAYVLGEYEQTEELLLRALSIRESKLGPDNPIVAVSLNDLAQLYTTQGQNYEQAETLHKRALMIREKVHGFRHPEVANSLNNLAELYRALKRYSEAENLCYQALSIREELLGPRHLMIF